jgi:SAM-dependent methyltransferase
MAGPPCPAAEARSVGPSRCHPYVVRMLDASKAIALEYSQRAEAYARYWAPVIHPMAQPLLEAMPLTGTRRILDVGTGSGGLWPAVQRAAPRARLWGFDRAQGMLAAGGADLRHRVAVMDAQRLGFRPGTFDAALLLFVLFHVPDPIVALREVRSSLTPNGQLGLVVWGADPGLPGAPIWAEELDRVGAKPDPRDPSVMRQAWMDTPAKLAGLLAQAGFLADRLWSRTFAHRWTVPALVATQTHCGLPSRRLEGLDGAARRVCVERVRTQLEELSPEALTYHVELVYGLAHRPA